MVSKRDQTGSIACENLWKEVGEEERRLVDKNGVEYIKLENGI